MKIATNIQIATKKFQKKSWKEDFDQNVSFYRNQMDYTNVLYLVKVFEC